MNFYSSNSFDDVEYMYFLNAINESGAFLETTDFGKVNAIIRWILQNTEYDVWLVYDKVNKYATRLTQTKIFCSMCEFCSIKADEIFCMDENIAIVKIDEYWYEFDIYFSSYHPEEIKSRQYDYSFYHLKERAQMYTPIYGYQFVKIDNLTSGNATTLCRSIRKAGFTKENGYSIWDISDMFLTYI